MSPKVSILCIALFAAIPSARAAMDARSAEASPPRDATADRPSLAVLLEAARTKSAVPALAAVATRADGVLEIAVAGIRRHGKPDPVSSEDLFHIGSNGKAMTATLLGILVEKGELSWTTTPLDVFSEWKDLILQDYRAITITDLLSHRAGLAAYTDDESPEFRDAKSLPGSPLEQRKEFALRALRRKPVVAPKSKMMYSNGGYSVAAAMAERAGKEEYESLIQTRLFGPLGMHPVVGWPAHSDPHQPWGHFETKKGVKPHDPHDSYQLPPFLIPAGGMSVTLADYAKFLQLHLRGLEGRDGLLKAETIKHLHTRVDETVALGWGVVDLEGAPASVHSGSGGTFFAVVALWPSRDRGRRSCHGRRPRSEGVRGDAESHGPPVRCALYSRALIHAPANRQSRSIVERETASTSAISSLSSPQ
jgi:CubicO group peptidase (beta-lactamase class C family)